ncbi:bifunctional phosphatase PAP2/diacylglycerol kinase family protein [Actinocorallia longicatena]|uniref:Bifunctional phosphatase PAP2/diacylglycerol kinase family protein n=1 Tax=Actinocorallia longicatena TaxID=111803 RepID=A0ABP6QN31_9ACTN
MAAAKLTGLEFVLPRLSRVADHGVLWFGTAAVLGASGRPAHRRGALRGLIALSMASPAVNLVGKQIFRRRRPRVNLVPKIRIHRLPTSPAFPSGHTASAAAFATALAMEVPWKVSVPVAAVAAAVGFSRVYTGAHYPGDVLAGAASGVAAGLATRLLWPPHPGPAHVARLTRTAEEVTPSGEGVVVFANTDEDLTELLPDAEFIAAGDDIPGQLDAAAAKAKVLAVCGGDGTVGAAADAALRHDVPLLVIPTGTLNHFSRALGIETVAEALDAYRNGCLAKVDVGMVNGVPFLNTASFGAYTELVDRREKLENRLGKWPALAVAAAKVLHRAEPVEVEIDGEPRRVWLAFIGNCSYQSRGAAPTWRDDLDDGLLDVRIIEAGDRLRRLRALSAVLVGHLHLSREYEHWQTPSLRLDYEGRTLRIAHDGETRDTAAPVVFEKHLTRLRVFVPKAAG